MHAFILVITNHLTAAFQIERNTPATQILIHWLAVSGNCFLLWAARKQRCIGLATVQSFSLGAILFQNLIYYGFLVAGDGNPWVDFDVLAVCVNAMYFRWLGSRSLLISNIYLLLIATWFYEYSLADDEQRMMANHIYWLRISLSIFVTWLFAGMLYSGRIGNPDKE